MDSAYLNNWIKDESKVIDLGCGDGSLLRDLMNTKSVIACIDRRFDSLISQYYDSIGQTGDYYMITDAGSSLPFSYNNISKNPKFNC